MSLPLRVPWASPADFEAVFELLFSSDGQVASQQLAIDRIHTWQSRQCCPYAAEATASLLSVILLDAPSTTTASLRLAYSMALIRFVNGLVDPAQMGPFARSIAGIAAQIGLPLWFVELRHAATHEDLPGLDVLRDAARKAMDWLYARYWLPQMQAVSGGHDDPAANDVVPEEQRKKLADLLAAYKAHRKQALRDLSKAIDKEEARLVKAVERWVIEALSGQVAGIRQGQTSPGAACAILAEMLCETGHLVPTSKKKRSSGRGGSLSIPEELQAIWEPLLEHLDVTFEDFSSALIWTMLDVLAAWSESQNATQQTSMTASASIDKSYLATLASWLALLVEKEDDNVQREVIRSSLLRPSPHLSSIVQTVLLPKHPDLAPGVSQLQRIERSQPALVPPANDDEVQRALLRMEERLKQLEAAWRQTLGPSPSRPAAASNGTIGEAQVWQLIPEDKWRPRPFGMLSDGRLPVLEAPPLPVM